MPPSKATKPLVTLQAHRRHLRQQLTRVERRITETQEHLQRIEGRLAILQPARREAA